MDRIGAKTKTIRKQRPSDARRDKTARRGSRLARAAARMPRPANDQTGTEPLTPDELIGVPMEAPVTEGEVTSFPEEELGLDPAAEAGPEALASGDDAIEE